MSFVELCVMLLNIFSTFFIFLELGVIIQYFIRLYAYWKEVNIIKSKSGLDNYEIRRFNEKDNFRIVKVVETVQETYVNDKGSLSEYDEADIRVGEKQKVFKTVAHYHNNINFNNIKIEHRRLKLRLLEPSSWEYNEMKNNFCNMNGNIFMSDRLDELHLIGKTVDGQFIVEYAGDDIDHVIGHIFPFNEPCLVTNTIMLAVCIVIRLTTYLAF